MVKIINKEWLLEKIRKADIRIADCRFALGDPTKGKQEYDNSHIPGAVFFDLEKDLSGPVSEHGGRHPLPNIDEFVYKLELAGINEKVPVFAYDQGEGAFAARFGWMLQYLGHENVYVLDGGYNAWIEETLPVTVEVPVYQQEKFNVNLKPELLATIDDVMSVVSGMTPHTVLIDSREQKRYLGLEEPIDKKAGRIPGAINKPWFEGLQSGHYLPAVEQKQRFIDLDQDQNIIVYCGSGVTAVPNYLALKQAGFNKVKLYLGSFSDWISYSENKIE
ncbi:sulfurtransferase [Bacillus sp. MRMR6]|uniref:sulfurtransferase n=1 Tax=Bacillus sp. MRMR6 TaxID=1928617 RepID=UPI0009512FE5|nr:sulfurtransferase [Bacillus sp. MRMR6]OLS40296.1 sulfurtransferase [Bacillus sp. MRMR6]